jgi:hypothetical protein
MKGSVNRVCLSTFIQTNPLKIDSMILFIMDDTHKSLNDV